MADILDKLVDDVKNDVTEMCAKVAEIHRVRSPDNEWQRGYNSAVADIAAKIRQLRKVTA